MRFTYRLAVLPRLKREHVTKIKKMFEKFIWNDKKAKINYSILTGLKSDGGLGLVDIEAKDTAQKLRWVGKLKDSETLSEQTYALIQNPIGDWLWGPTLHKNETCEVMNPISKFWSQTMYAWYGKSRNVIRNT